MKINKYFPFVFLYFFINTIGLPSGLLYTTLLTPVFYFWLLSKGKKQILLKFSICLAPFVLAHLINGVDIGVYIRSVVLLLTVYIFSYTFYTWITTYDDVEGIFRRLLIANFLFTLVALCFVLTPYRSLFWLNWSISNAGIAIENWPRLTLFSYEPSHYATLLVPFFAYYFIKFILKQREQNSLLMLMMIVLPLVLSLSMGVISGLIISIAILFLLNATRFLGSKKLLYSLSAIVISFIVLFLVLLVFYRNNPFFVRIMAIVAGKDGSARGRTYEAFYLAYKIAHLKSLVWGIGPGEIKVIGDPIIKAYYEYPDTYGQVSIPAALAETFALFGMVGTFIRLFAEVYLFFKTRVLDNYFRTLLFFYMFVYQFTGSFVTNIAEYVIWILAFTNIFPQFDKQVKKENIPVNLLSTE